MIRSAFVALLLGLLPTVAGAQSAAPDMTDYQALLNQYARPMQAKQQPYDSRFDYGQLYVDQNIWKLHASERLDRIHVQLLSAQPSLMTERERIAWALNTYNFLVIERVTLNLLVPKRGFQRFRSVDEIVLNEGKFFVARVIQVEGRPYSLDEFERRFVYGDTTPIRMRRTVARDPRLQFALCQGRLGGPPLLLRAFRADSLDRQLDVAARTALALPRFVNFDTARSLLVVSERLHQYGVDFGGVPQMMEFIRKYGPREVAEGLRRARLTDVGRYVETDLKLNYFEHVQEFSPATSGQTITP